MSLNKLTDLGRSLVFRLTLLYAGMFTLLTLFVFSLFYFLISSYIYGRIDSYLAAEVTEGRMMLATSGLAELKDDIAREETAHGENKIFFRMTAPDGSVLSSSDMEAWGDYPPRPEIIQRVTEDKPVWTTEIIPGEIHTTRTIHAFIGPGVILEIGQTLKAEEEFMGVFRRILTAVLLVGVSVAAIGGWIMGNRALSGVKDLTQTALRITSGGFRHRVPVKGSGDEVDNLAAVFNQMLDRIQALITGMREVNDNIAHDLRSPITRIRGLAETIITGEESLEAYRTLASSTIEECDRLLEMINTMLDISEMHAGVSKNDICEVDIAEMIKETSELFRPVAEDKAIRLSVRVEQQTVVRGDKRRLQRALANFLDNALKYTAAGGEVIFSTELEGEQAVIRITDTGTGIPPDELPRIFEKFYRGEMARSLPGSGLGLSLAQAIIQSHGGNVSVTSYLGSGSNFTVNLPL